MDISQLGTMRESIACNIRDFRKRAGMTQEELADAIGSTKSAISKYELGHRFPDPDTMEAIADVLKVPAMYLMAGKEIGDMAIEALNSHLIARVPAPWKSDKAARLYMCIDSHLLDVLDRIAKINNRSLEDEIEYILHDETERIIEESYDNGEQLSYPEDIDIHTPQSAAETPIDSPDGNDEP